MLVGRSLGGTADTGCPSMKISPDVGDSKPASMRRSVVFPQPDGPSSEKNSPRWLSKARSSPAFTEPKCFDTLRMEIMLSLAVIVTTFRRLFLLIGRQTKR